MNDVALKVEDLHTYFYTKQGVVQAVKGVNLALRKESILGVVGESGSGKSVTALSILRLVPPPGRIIRGKVYLNGMSLLDLPSRRLRGIRGKEIAVVFQDPAVALNPVIRLGPQMEEIFLAHSDMSRRAARESAVNVLKIVGLSASILDRYAFQLSGGMAQRVMLAIAMALNPQVLIADEPTSNLDVTLQAQILEHIKGLRDRYHSSILLITHDMGIIARMADDVAVMYAGSVVEYSDARSLFRHPSHPYTWALFQSLPRLDAPDRPLIAMKGAPPSMIDLPDQCPFLPRCSKATMACRLSPRPELKEITPGHRVACYNEIRDDYV